ncbi:hypothetical protein K443DRAFT_561433 [Laccaria amethystina LaAM-08-1]|uniref:Uncharacterized protein n=1 Tax=Laccaria amethystina LaAM-08-1 TaxID=1095629 RepID=A0A0C9YKG2_9AGAR|nr:hypothetical protein K443DRAFT_561433 [Laccaria amethystina LaAM-08-1]
MALACLVIGNSLMKMPVKLLILKLPHVSLLVYSRSGIMRWLRARFIARLTMYFPASYRRITRYCMMLIHIWRFMQYACPAPFQLYRCTWY